MRLLVMLALLSLLVKRRRQMMWSMKWSWKKI
jgi:hypothetical protein